MKNLYFLFALLLLVGAGCSGSTDVPPSELGQPESVQAEENDVDVDEAAQIHLEVQE